MKMIYIVIALVLAAGMVFVFVNRNTLSAKNKVVTTSPTDSTPAKHTESNNPYKDLRNMALSATPEQLEITLPNDKTVVYGVVMDWEMGEGIATTISFQTGDASLYLSSGGGYIGGSNKPNVNSAAKQFVNQAQNYLNKAVKTETTPLPSKDEIRFYLLTNKGIYLGTEQMKNFNNGSSGWLKLFEEGNNVLTELRNTGE